MTTYKNIITGRLENKCSGDLICNTCNILITKDDYFGSAMLPRYYQGIIAPCPLCCDGMHGYFPYKLTFNHPIREFMLHL